MSRAAFGFAGLLAGAALALPIGLGLGAEVGLRSAAAQAAPVRLVGLCSGRLLGALEEDAFPAGCSWIEPVRFAPALVSPV